MLVVCVYLLRVWLSKVEIIKIYMLVFCYFEQDLSTEKKHLQPIMSALILSELKITHKEHPI
ncbi:hypothetical protein CWC11_07835 [Pseudoalteromonas sp. S3178]|nr:hypothetical protein CWC11_07835 [Pseudoalteromonas sp. S3178]